MPAMFMRLIDMRLVRYLLASVGALAVDLGTFLALLSLGMRAAGASCAPCDSIRVNWTISRPFC